MGLLLGRSGRDTTHTHSPPPLTEYNKTRKKERRRRRRRKKALPQSQKKPTSLAQPPASAANNQQPNDIIILQVEFISVLLLPLLKEMPFPPLSLSQSLFTVHFLEEKKKKNNRLYAGV
jgi:hypothetical protein